MKKIASFFLALTLCAGLAIPASAAGFSDVPADYWAKEAIDRAVSDGVVGGYPDGTFRPASAVSYGAFSLMLARAFYSGELASYPSGGTEAGEAIMNRHNILNGTGRASRSSAVDLPREDMAQCMYNLLVDLGMSIPSASEYAKAMSFISDYDTVSGNCRRGVLVCYTLGLLGGLGDGSFGPQKSMNRAQAAVVIGRLQDYVQNSGGTADVVEIPSGPEPKAPPQAEVAPTVSDGPLFKMLDGENAQQMMDRINASITFTQGCLSNGKPITESNIQEILGLARETMPDGTPWDGADTYKYRSPKFGSYWGNAGKCAGFAACLSDYLFTSDAPLLKHQDFSQLKVGDVIDIRNSDNGVKHAIVITDIDWASGMYSWCSGNDGGTVRWRGGNGTGYLNTFEEPSIASGTYIYSRY